MLSARRSLLQHPSKVRPEEVSDVDDVDADDQVPTKLSALHLKCFKSDISSTSISRYIYDFFETKKLNPHLLEQCTKDLYSEMADFYP